MNQRQRGHVRLSRSGRLRPRPAAGDIPPYDLRLSGARVPALSVQSLQPGVGPIRQQPLRGLDGGSEIERQYARGVRRTRQCRLERFAVSAGQFASGVGVQPALQPFLKRFVAGDGVPDHRPGPDHRQVAADRGRGQVDPAVIHVEGAPGLLQQILGCRQFEPRPGQRMLADVADAQHLLSGKVEHRMARRQEQGAVLPRHLWITGDAHRFR